MHRLLRLCICLSGFAVTTLPCLAQNRYPQDYFRNPLNIPILLAGNYGECRPGHFHSGIDIKTAGRENLPVFAAADGYISRIKMEPGGFGHGLYITHPNGYTTLYAHLNNFIPALQQYVRDAQYKRESWTVDLSFTPDQFPVKKGDQIAFSGNTGGSTAPHLHFEIRDTKTEHPLNPQLFGLEIPDTKAPLPLKLAVYNSALSIYSDSPAIYSLVKKGSYYTTKPDTLIVNDENGIGIEVNDFMNGSDNTLAYYTAEWLVDSALQGRIRLDDIGYDETRYLHAFADYKTRKLQRTWIQCLFKLPGNKLDHLYEGLNADRGLIIMPDNETHEVLIVLTDVARNTTNIRCHIKRGNPSVSLPCNERLAAQKVTKSNHPNISYTLDKTALYDDVCYTFNSEQEEKGYSETYQLGEVYAPVHHYFDLQIKPGKPVPFSLRSKIAMIYSDGKEEDGRAATPSDKGWFKASVRNLGKYRLDIDTTAPVIKLTFPWKADQSKAFRITFTVRDEITSVKTFRGELDGKWILFEQHEDNWFYEIDSHCPKGKHKLIITVTDENGNSKSQTYSFNR